jgi:hypothetical protein
MIQAARRFASFGFRCFEFEKRATLELGGKPWYSTLHRILDKYYTEHINCNTSPCTSSLMHFQRAWAKNFWHSKEGQTSTQKSTTAY